MDFPLPDLLFFPDVDLVAVDSPDSDSLTSSAFESPESSAVSRTFAFPAFDFSPFEPESKPQPGSANEIRQTITAVLKIPARNILAIAVPATLTAIATLSGTRGCGSRRWPRSSRCR